MNILCPFNSIIQCIKIFIDCFMQFFKGITIPTCEQYVMCYLVYHSVNGLGFYLSQLTFFNRFDDFLGRSVSRSQTKFLFRSINRFIHRSISLDIHICKSITRDQIYRIDNTGHEDPTDQKPHDSPKRRYGNFQIAFRKDISARRHDGAFGKLAGLRNFLSGFDGSSSQRIELLEFFLSDGPANKTYGNAGQGA